MFEIILIAITITIIVVAAVIGIYSARLRCKLKDIPTVETNIPEENTDHPPESELTPGMELPADQSYEGKAETLYYYLQQNGKYHIVFSGFKKRDSNGNLVDVEISYNDVNKNELFTENVGQLDVSEMDIVYGDVRGINEKGNGTE